ncbi:glycoside hydrolase family 88/105 protein [Chitinophaga rhizophila]|uniref:Glycoside hydrolase family 88 protein n=1 Tax=Chitinophaga rhizophila TaxID=2866212 RepID=A0ABS7G9L3_9BACT|nr:glycoside hydrolase family 88 protein [Chitinophaga rhizophila]MBW8684334.1 glycoside hydrolase family 88 protein [Chitinophaga rhizophila]
MKMRLLVAAALLSICTYVPVQAQSSLPPKKEVLKTLTLANRYFMNKWPDAGKQIVLHKTWPSNIWTRAVYYEGLMALHQIDPQKEYYDYAIQWGEKHKWGLRGGITTRNADNQACGQTYIDLYLIDKKKHEHRIHDIKASIDSMMKTEKVDDWNWIDAIQMAMPVMAQLGKLYNDTAYFRRMYEMYAYSKFQHGTEGLYNAKESLWWRDKDFVPPYKEPNGANCYWSRGNGWVLAALVRTMDLLPEKSPYYKIFLQDFKDMSAAILKIQRPDGFWNASLHDPSNYGGKELTGTSLFVYGMAWGVRKGYLDKKTYQPAITKAWNALAKECVHENGMLGYVQSTGKQPSDGQPVSYDKIPDFEDFGLGCFLLAGSEIYKSK